MIIGRIWTERFDIVSAVVAFLAGLYTLGAGIGLLVKVLDPIYGWISLILISIIIITASLMKLYVFATRPDVIDILYTKITVDSSLQSSNPYDGNAIVTRERYFHVYKPLRDSIYEGNFTTDGSLRRITSDLVVVDHAPTDSPPLEEIKTFLPKIDLPTTPGSSIMEMEWPFEGKLEIRRSQFRKKIYRHVAVWEIEGGFKKHQEFYDLTVGHNTKYAVLEIRCHKDRPFVDGSAFVTQTSVKGTKVKIDFDGDSPIIEQGRVFWGVLRPCKGDSFKLNWKWGTNGTPK